MRQSPSHPISSAMEHRVSRLFDPISGRTLIVPVDDSLITGPNHGLERVDEKIGMISTQRPQAVLGYPGHFARQGRVLRNASWIFNLSASTRHHQHTRKYQIMSPEQAMWLGADCVAVHVNYTSQYEPEMVKNLARATVESHRVGLPVLAIVYPRKEDDRGEDDNYLKLKASDPHAYAELVARGVRLATDLGADIVKTTYSGSPETFESVISSAESVPVVVAGGPMLPMPDAIALAVGALAGGAAGISFGRNVFSRSDPSEVLSMLNHVVHGRQDRP